MTVCIAAIAKSGKKVVLAADNMMTIRIGNTIQYQKESKDHKKIVKLNDNSFALFAGSLNVISPLMDYAKKQIKSNDSPQKAAERIRSELQRFALQKIEEEVLKPTGFDWNTFKTKQNDINPEIVKDLYGKINQFKLDVNTIIAGFDQESEQCYLGQVSGNGNLVDRTLEGFFTNGTGGDLAKFSLVLSDYSQSLEAKEVEDLVKKAIQDARKSPGVGDLGDLITIPT